MISKIHKSPLPLNKTNYIYQIIPDYNEIVHTNTIKKLIQALLREQILSAKMDNNTCIIILPKTGRLLYLKDMISGSLNRLISIKKIMIKQNNHFLMIKNSLHLLEIISQELSNDHNIEQWQTFTIEIADHVRNAQLSHLHAFKLKNKIRYDAQTAGHKDFFSWLQNNATVQNKPLFIEQFSSQGHPHHPCSKTKLGINVADIKKVSPEFQPTIKLSIVAVKATLIHIESLIAEDYAHWFAQNYPAVWQKFKTALLIRNLKPNDYLPLPVHPWQAKHYVQTIFTDAITRQEICFFEEVTLNASPTLSFRTLASTADLKSAYIKLPIAVQATSSVRTLSPASTVNSPRISQLINEILIRENGFGHRLSALSERYGLHLKNFSETQSKHLTVIFRENVNEQLKEDETCVVVAALFERSPITKVPLLIELMNMAKTNNLNQAIDYFKQYASLVIGSYLDLYLRYGIGLEGHQQNTLAIFRQGNITRFIARDFDGTDIHEPTLKKTAFSLALYPKSKVLTDDKTHVRNAFLHAVYQCHLGEIVLLLAQHYQCEEKLFWQVIKTLTKQRFEQLKSEMDEREWQAEYHAILHQQWSSKSFIYMRLAQKESSYGHYVNVINPLHN